MARETAGRLRPRLPLDVEDAKRITGDFIDYYGRGRDSGYPEPPAQIPAGGITAPGSYLECLASKKRSSGWG